MILMTKEKYEKITSTLRGNERISKALSYLNRLLTYFIFAAYPAMLIYLFFEKRELLLRAVTVPAAGFFILSIFRRAVNSPRPYEVFGIPPVIPKKTKGKSFPSRHVFCVALIGMTALYTFESCIFGIAIMIIALMMSFLRVFSGIHFPRDVIAGFFCGIIVGAVLFI